ncbi:MAG: hypothetical protein H6978_06200 [Gammaproteobacteria bacterium]|nr:hypothetical protein [Gammaproteobacteria bacterium]
MSDADPGQQSSGDQSPNIRTDSGDVNITYNAVSTSWLRAIPDYVDQLLHLLPAPRRFFTTLDFTQRTPLVQGLTFLALSAVIAWLMRAPLAADSVGYWSTAVINLVSVIITSLLFGVIAFGCCRSMGGAASLRTHIAAFAFMGGMTAILFLLVNLLAQGIVLVAMKEHIALYREYMTLFFAGDDAINQTRFAVLEQGWALKLSMATLLLGTIAILIWLAAAWRGLGDLNKLGGRRVALSLVLFLIIGAGANAVLSEWQAALVQVTRGDVTAVGTR